MGGGLQVYDVGESTILPIYYYSIIDGTWWTCVYLSEIMFMLLSPEFIHICLQCLYKYISLSSLLYSHSHSPLLKPPSFIQDNPSSTFNIMPNTIIHLHTITLPSRSQNIFYTLSITVTPNYSYAYTSYTTTMISSRGLRVRLGTVALDEGYPRGRSSIIFSFLGRPRRLRRAGPQLRGVEVRVTRPAY